MWKLECPQVPQETRAPVGNITIESTEIPAKWYVSQPHWGSTLTYFCLMLLPSHSSVQGSAVPAAIKLESGTLGSCYKDGVMDTWR